MKCKSLLLVLMFTLTSLLRANRNRLYVPEWLLEEWGITVDPPFSAAA